MAERFGSYVLVGKTQKEKIIIDWTKVQKFATDKKRKYKLDRIDYFTSHFLNREELLDLLLKTGLITPEQSIGMSFWVYPASQSQNGKKLIEPKLSPDHLEYGIAYRRVSKYLEDDSALIAFLQSKLDDFKFIQALYNKYANESNGKYGKKKLENLQYMYDHELNEGKKKGYLVQLIHVREQHSLLRNIYAYSQMKSNGEYIEKEQYESVRNNIREFFIREVYNVIRTTDGLYDNRELELGKNKDGSYQTSYINRHHLVMFISKQLVDEEAEIMKQEKLAKQRADQVRSNPVSPYHQEPRKHTVKRRKNSQIEGQITLFDYAPSVFGGDNTPQNQSNGRQVSKKEIEDILARGSLDDGEKKKTL